MILLFQDIEKILKDTIEEVIINSTKNIVENLISFLTKVFLFIIKNKFYYIKANAFLNKREKNDLFNLKMHQFASIGKKNHKFFFNFFVLTIN